MSERTLRLTAAALACCGLSNSSVIAQTLPTPNYNNGAYVTSQIAGGGDGATARASCLTDAVIPGTGEPGEYTPTQSLYQYFSTYCSIYPDPTNTLNSLEGRPRPFRGIPEMGQRPTSFGWEALEVTQKTYITPARSRVPP